MPRTGWRPSAASDATLMTRRGRGLVVLWCLLPSAVIIGAFHLGPLFYALWVSLHEWTVARGRFVGLGNYRQLLVDPAFRQSLGVTLWYVLGTVPATLLLAY